MSTAEQADSGLGIEAQKSTILAEVRRRDWVLVAETGDPGCSGRDMVGRPGLQLALDLLATGEADVLVVSKLDRLSRSMLDFTHLMAIGKRERWSLVALDLGVDTSSPSGELLASIMMSTAQWERRLAGQRTREALAARKAQGLALGRPPSIDPATVERIITSYTAGLSMAEIARRLNADRVPTARGGGTWYPSTIQTVIRRSGPTSVRSTVR